MKHLPNILSSLRIVGTVVLLLSDVSSILFGVLYIVCGISDIADGWLARKLKCVTRTGALLDSVADICFVACCAWKLPADTRTATMAMVVGRSNRRD